MNPTLFFENFELLADAPNGVQKLRELILQLAVMGKLVPQDPNDEQASALLDKVKAEKKRSIKEGKLNSTKQLVPVKTEEQPFDSPVYWKWCRLGDIFDIVSGNAFKSGDFNEEEGIKTIKITNVGVGNFIGTNDYLPFEYDKIYPQFLVNSGDILIALTRPYISDGLKVCYCPPNYENSLLNQRVAAMKGIIKELSIDFVYYYLKSLYVLDYVKEKSKTMNQPNLSIKDLNNLSLPIPPLAEQKRIVSKVDELMTLCDKLEARRQKKQEIQSNLNNAALEKMLSAENQEEFEQNWQSICENFDLLYDNPENVEKLKQAILQLAVQGKLVEQNPEDEPASVLIEKIRTERTVGKENKINKSEKYSAIDLDQKIFDTHSNWSWCKFAEIATIQSNLVSPANYPDLPHIAPNNIEKGTGKLLEYTTVAEDGVTSPKHYFYSGQLLYSKIRPNLSKVVIASFEGLCSADMYPIKSHIDTKYLYLYILSETFLMQVTGNDNRVAMPKVNQQQLSNVLVPLPPLAEQKRIVEKIKQLMGLCDELELKLRKEREDSGKLMETVVRGLLEGAAA
ncbi:restriction endonuclease subunit S [Methanosarcina sp.]|uniref:restriction endonuclease subunit S n=1 Tax=Methanosarcina sp. TaxID=2213 RepID=UPI003BB7251C